MPVWDGNNFNLFLNSCKSSMGESMLSALSILFDIMNETKQVNFPIKQIQEQISNCNETWKEHLENILKYYKNNHINVTQEDFEFTVLIDEPDRNLDIVHIKELYNILSYHRPMTQLIVVIHNPVLIYKLAQTDANFIELTPNYLYKIKEFINWTNIHK